MKNFCFFLLALLVFPANLVFSKTWRLNNDPTVASDFKTLQGAIDTSSAGDTLYIEGTQFDYSCDSISKQLVIYGPGYFMAENDSLSYQSAPAVVKGTNGTINLRENAAYTEIYGLKMIPGSKINILCNHVTMARNYIELPNLDRLTIDDGVSHTCIKQNYIYGTIELNNSLNTIIKNNIIIGGIRSGNEGAAVIHNNIFRYIQVNNSEIKSNIQYKEGNNSGNLGTNNIYRHNILCAEWASELTDNNKILTDNSTLFLEDNPSYSNDTEYSTDRRYMLIANSPAEAAGEGGTDCGAFGGNDPYALSGLPDLPSIYEVEMPASATAESGLPITIKVKTK